MLKIARTLVVATFFVFTPLSVMSQGQAVSGPANAPRIMPLADVKEGYRGIAKTVFRGSVPEEFNVEILGVVPGAIGPHQDMIIGKLSGANAERTFVFAGMSGSPVYVDGKIIGAIAYSFPFAKEPICGITPIEQMISIFEAAPAPRQIAGGARAVSYAELQASRWLPAMPGNIRSNARLSGMAADSRLMPIAGQTFVPIATPVTFSGVSQSTLDQFAPELAKAGILPVASLGGGSNISPLKPFDDKTLLGGDSVVVQLARGDISIAAAGTVTMRDNNKIYAFGHPYFGLGSTDLPMSESHVVTVVPNTNNSFKLAVSDATVGALTQDRATGIFGVLGRSPKMMPIKLRITTSRGRSEEINFETGIDDFLTPLVLNVGSLNSIAAFERGLGDTTIRVNAEIGVRGEAPIKIERRFTGQQASSFAASAAVVQLSTLMKTTFPGMEITGVNVVMTVDEGSRAAALERISIDRTQVRPGETLDMTAFIRTETGAFITQPIKVLIPSDAPVGALSLMVGDGAAIQQNAAIQQFVPRSAAELIRTINSIKRPDQLYVFGYKTAAGAVVGSSEMPNLPPSMLATMNNDRTAGGSKSSTQKTIIDLAVAPGEYIVTGSQTISVEVVR